MSNSDRLDRAERALADGDVRSAIIDCKDVLQDEPDNTRGRLLLARASLAAGDPAAAQKELERALSLGADRGEVIVDLGRSLLLQEKFGDFLQTVSIDGSLSSDVVLVLTQLSGDAYLGLAEYAKAREYYELVLASDPENVDAKLGFISSLSKEGNDLQARANMDNVISEHGDDARVWMASALLNAQVRDLGSAEREFKKALEMVGTSGASALRAEALVGLASVQIDTSQIDAARETVSQLEAVAPTAPSTLISDARIAYIDGELDRATDNLQRILRDYPNFRIAQLLLGAVKLRQGNLGQAEMYLSTVVAAMPESVDARRLLAETRLRMDEADAAREVLQPVLTSGTADAQSLSIAASVSLSQARVDEAVDFMEQSVAADPLNPNLQLQLALAYLQAQRVEDANRILDRLPDSDDAAFDFRRGAIQALSRFQVGEHGAALAAASKIVDRNPSNINAYSLYATIALAVGDSSLSRKILERGLEVAPDDPNARRLLASLDESQGDMDAARKHYEHVLSVAPETTWALFAMARNAAHKGETDEARRWLSRTINVDPESMIPRLQLARIEIESDQNDRAKAVLLEVLKEQPGNAEAHNFLGIAAMKERQFESAQEYFRRAAQLDESSTVYQLNMARAIRAGGDAERALEVADNSIGSDLNNIRAVVAVASMRAEHGDIEEALSLARQLQQAHPNDPIPFALEAELKASSGDFNGASLAYDRALDVQVVRSHALRAFVVRRTIEHADATEPLQLLLEQRPLDVDARMILANYYMSESRHSESIAEYESLIAHQPDNGIALNNLAWAYLQNDDPRAVATARKALEILPDNASVIDTMGWTLVNTGAHDEAEPLLRRAVELSGKQPEIEYHHAVALSLSGQRDEARAALQSLLSRDDEFVSRKEAESLLSRLR